MDEFEFKLNLNLFDVPSEKLLSEASQLSTSPQPHRLPPNAATLPLDNEVDTKYTTELRVQHMGRIICDVIGLLKNRLDIYFLGVRA